MVRIAPDDGCRCRAIVQDLWIKIFSGSGLGLSSAIGDGDRVDFDQVAG
jgi:hypothetical protein